MKIKRIMLALITLLFFSLMKNEAFAEPATSMVISPMSQRLILKPGESVTANIKITNPASSASEMKYSATVGSFSQYKDDGSKDDYGAADFSIKSNYNQIMDWITLSKEEGVIAPNETDVFSFRIDVPEDAPAGGQYASILFTNVTGDGKNSGGNVMIESFTQVASIIYAEVTGETIRSGSILENSMPTFLFDGPLEATSMVKNEGNIHTDAKYILQVWPLFSDEEICSNEEDPNKSIVLPNTEKYHTESCELPPVGIFRAKQTVEIFGTKSETPEKIIIKCPIWLLFIIIFAIVALIIWIILRAKNRGNKRRAEA